MRTTQRFQLRDERNHKAPPFVLVLQHFKDGTKAAAYVGSKRVAVARQPSEAQAVTIVLQTLRQRRWGH